MGGYDEEASRRRHRLADPDGLCGHFAIRCHLSAVKRSLDHRRQCGRLLRNTQILARADDVVNRATELRTNAIDHDIDDAPVVLVPGISVE